MNNLLSKNIYMKAISHTISAAACACYSYNKQLTSAKIQARNLILQLYKQLRKNSAVMVLSLKSIFGPSNHPIP